MKNGKVGWAEEFRKKILPADIRSLRKTLKSVLTLRVDSILIMLECFVEKTGYKNMVIWHKPNPEAKIHKSISYVLIVTPRKIQLFKEYTDELFSCKWEDGELVDEYSSGEGLAAIKNLFEKMLEEKTPVLL